ncbi:MAG: YhgE/Pip family protein [Mycolicibacterium sp.]
MLAAMSLGTDIKRYTRGIPPRIALLTVILMPLLYGAMYLWAFWDPFGHVNKVPVALVNLDTGTQSDGKDIRAGDQVAKALVDSRELDLHEVSSTEAADGLAHGRYYFTITIPADFSADIASPSGGNPTQAGLRFTFNDSNSYIGSIIGQNVARAVINEVNANVGEQTVVAVLDGLTDAGAGLIKAANGAGQLADGLDTARDGSAQLADGTAQLRSSVDETTGPLIDVLGRVERMQLDPEVIGITAQRLSSAVASTTGRLEALNIDWKRAGSIVDQTVSTLQSNSDPTVRQAGDVLAVAQALLRQHDVDPATDRGLQHLRDNASQLEYELGDPNSKLREFMTGALNGDLRADIVKLRDGVDQLDDGAHQLSSGLVQLADGGRELADGLQLGSTQIPSWTDKQRTDVAKTVSSPVKLDLVTHNPAPVFGTGFAPFFLGLAVFIGALLIWMVLKPMQPRPIINGLSGFRVVLASYWPAFLIATCQVLVMYTVAHFGVGLNPRYPLYTAGFLLLVLSTYLALIQALNAVFGVAVGRVVTLAFLMVQLVSCGGIYPVQTTGKLFQILHPYVPMTYSVNGLRQLIAGGIDHRLAVAVAVLSGVLATSLAVSAWAALRSRQYTMEQLHPPIEV